MEKSFIILFRNAFEKFVKSFPTHVKLNEKKEKVLSLTEKEIKNKKEYDCDLSELSSNKRQKVTEAVEKELKNIKDYVIEENIKSYESQSEKKITENLIDEYINYDGIKDVLLIKKMIWFYYRELAFYESKNERIFDYLTKKNCFNKDKNKDNFKNRLLPIENKNVEDKIENKNILIEIFEEEKIKNKNVNMTLEEL